MRGRSKMLLVLSMICLFHSLISAEDQGQASEIFDLLPRAGEVGGWVPEGEPEYAAGEDLFFLINGGAAIYREYGFKEAVYQAYTTEDGKSINLEIYAMDSSQAAFGIYSFKTGRDGKRVESVHDGWLESYYFNFWKGHYQVTVVGLDTDASTADSSLVGIARAVDGKIESESRTPQIVSVFSHQQLLPNGITYLKGNLAISNRYLFDKTNVFGLQEGAIGEYEDHWIFIFEYENEKESLKWYGSAKNFFKESERFDDFADLVTRFEVVDLRGDRLTITAHEKWIIIVKGKGTSHAERLIEDYRRVLE